MSFSEQGVAQICVTIIIDKSDQKMGYLGAGYDTMIIYCLKIYRKTLLAVIDSLEENMFKFWLTRGKTT